ncbi:4Fe-4S binding protein [Promethearchaeum syntrophicum]|uniref:4Fe-4S binding protein n=1 Tax=Promethearchaeum syntrophicum TaxID=2594042 RepID=A0A5B9DD05_9ARCH|nr:4Fe-4S binding protein [Candidatus Prometheoarchaeum syntrophicum]QEE16650.1 Ferredoxin [Candidatus Prometheoarchaeum syntrophicum]
MGHISRSYLDLHKRLEKFPQQAPASEALFQILEILFTEKEATLVSKLPIKPFEIPKAAKIWKQSEDEAEIILNELADKGLLIDVIKENKRVFSLAPPMAGFFEFSLMRTDGKFDRKVLSELYYQYINKEDAFISMLFNLEPPIDRVFVHEDTLQDYDQSIILDYERASQVIETATCITVGTCYCRHKMEHLGKACDNPQEVCLTFNNAAKSLSKHGIAKKISKKEAYKILDEVRKLGLVQVGDNSQTGVSWICNCCGCCCEALLGYKRLGYSSNIYSNFEAKIDVDACTGCGICVDKCPVDAMDLTENPERKNIAQVNYDRCIGCGVCSRFCPSEAITMKRREKINFTPVDFFERIVLNAIEKGTLPNLIFDNFNLWTHKVFRRLMRIYFSLPKVKRSLVEDQLQSRYLRSMVKIYDKFNKGKLDNFNLDNYTHPELHPNKN